MTKNINDLVLDISNDLVLETLEKGLPPKLLYRLKALARKYLWNVPKKQVQQTMTTALARKMEEINNLKALKKNEVMASVYSNKTVRLDFGSGIPEEIKKKAMEWAKKKGLNVIEASLAKSTNNNSYLVLSYGNSFCDTAELVDNIKWEAV
jgi:hypothetical protein